MSPDGALRLTGLDLLDNLWLFRVLGERVD
jgi:hypothetical protein